MKPLTNKLRKKLKKATTLQITRLNMLGVSRVGGQWALMAGWFHNQPCQHIILVLDGETKQEEKIIVPIGMMYSAADLQYVLNSDGGSVGEVED
jgi:hypothetical protein